VHRLHRRRDVQAGALCVVLGLAMIAEARRYPLGTLRQIGTGFYPLVLGVLLALVGALIAISSIGGPPDAPELTEPPEWRGWACIVGGVTLFMLLARPGGLVVAIFSSVLVAALGDRQATLRGALTLAACMAGFGTLLFGVVLGVSLPIWPGVLTPLVAP
jgi:hypothetical protein